MANKGRQSRSVLTINGCIRFRRKWWHGKQVGSIAPADEILNRSEATITPGVLELACRENLSATSFAKAAANLARGIRRRCPRGPRVGRRIDAPSTTDTARRGSDWSNGEQS